MQKNMIDQTLDCADSIRKQLGKGSPQAFALTWIAWEQLNVRVLRVAAFEDGWNQSLVTKALKETSIGGRGLQIDKAIQRFAGVKPSAFDDLAGETWRQILELRYLRNQFIHGT
jgi:hypothetical protein